MEGALKTGSKLVSRGGVEYLITNKLGEGGQGEVYKVRHEKKDYALKWYFKHTATQKQKDIIENLIRKGPPDSSFLWPLDLIEKDAFFGYVMPLRTNEYKNIVDLMKRRADPSFRALAIAGANLAKGYRNLHSMGYCYRDISFGNLFFNPDTGDVLICDNDNVTVNGVDTGILGTPRFMAPEIVVGKKKPSIDTDLYSMALLLFYMFMIHHPLEGQLEANIKALDIHAMNQLYGTKPVFIWDPNDKSNRPVPGYQQNAIIYWKLYPQFIKDLFITSFTHGLHNERKRIVEKVWQDNFVKLADSIMYCPKCGSEVFYDDSKGKIGTGHICWNCNAAVTVPPSSLVIDKNTVLLNRTSKILQHHVKDDYNLANIVGEVVQNPTEPSKWGIKNTSDETWIYIKPDATHVPVPKGKTAAISRNASINFGQVIGKFILN